MELENAQAKAWREWWISTGQMNRLRPTDEPAEIISGLQRQVVDLQSQISLLQAKEPFLISATLATPATPNSPVAPLPPKPSLPDHLL